MWIFFSGVGVRSLTFPRGQFHKLKHGKLLSVLVSCGCRVIEVARFQSQLDAFFQSDRQIQKTHCRYLHPYGDICEEFARDNKISSLVLLQRQVFSL